MPSDPKHYPVLGNSVTSPRAMSRLQGSFKDRLLTTSAEESVDSGKAGGSGTEAAKATTMRDYTRSTSPRITAGRDITHGVVGPASSEASDWRAKEGQEVGWSRLHFCVWIRLHSSVSACHVAIYHDCISSTPCAWSYATACFCRVMLCLLGLRGVLRLRDGSLSPQGSTSPREGERQTSRQRERPKPAQSLTSQATLTALRHWERWTRASLRCLQTPSFMRRWTAKRQRMRSRVHKAGISLPAREVTLTFR